MADRVAIRPPEYFPNLAYFALMHEADLFVVADTFRYRRQTFQNRAKLRNPNGWQWITVPLESYGYNEPIREVQIETGGRWLEKHWRAFQYNYRSSPYFEYFESRIEPFFEREWTELGALTCASVELLHDLLDLSTPLVRASTLEGTPRTADEVMEHVEAQTLIIPEEDAGRHASGAMEIQTLAYESPTYRQNFEGFEPGMSAADVLFNYGPEAVSIIAEGATVADHASAE
jgi:hypothetical protein